MTSDISRSSGLPAVTSLPFAEVHRNAFNPRLAGLICPESGNIPAIEPGPSFDSMFAAAASGLTDVGESAKAAPEVVADFVFSDASHDLFGFPGALPECCNNTFSNGDGVPGACGNEAVFEADVA